MGHPQVIAHRWLDASQKQDIFSRVEEILKLDVKIVECDVRETKDEEFILSHDPYLPHLRRKIKEITSAEVIKDFGEKAYYNIALSTLLNLLEEKSSLKINLEIKDPQLNVEKLVSSIPHPLRKKIIISSFYPSVLRKISPADITERWLLTSISYRRHPIHIFFALFPLLAAHFSKATGIVPFHTLVNQSLIKKATKKGLKVIPWTVNNIKEIKKLTQWSVWGIISDYPKMIK